MKCRFCELRTEHITFYWGCLGLLVLTFQWFDLTYICLCFFHVLDSEQIFINCFLSFWFTFHYKLALKMTEVVGSFSHVLSGNHFFFPHCHKLVAFFSFVSFSPIQLKVEFCLCFKNLTLLERDGNVTWVNMLLWKLNTDSVPSYVSLINSHDSACMASPLFPFGRQKISLVTVLWQPLN